MVSWAYWIEQIGCPATCYYPWTDYLIFFILVCVEFKDLGPFAWVDPIEFALAFF